MIFTVLIMLGCYITGRAQNTTELVIFAENGEKFTLIIDGERQNPAPVSRVKVPGLMNEWYKVKILFENDQIPPIDDRIQTKAYRNPQSYEQCRQYTYMIKQKGNGKYVLRSSSWSFFDGTAPIVADGTPPPPAPSNETTYTTVQQTTTTTSAAPGGINMNVGANGMSITDPNGANINMNVNMDPNMGGTTTSTTTTTTTTSSSSSGGYVAPPSNIPPPPANGGCTYAMSRGDFETAKASINNQSFAEEKMKVAKQIVKAKCINSRQVKEIMGLFSFEENKLDFAKFAYDYTMDKDNYYTINDAFNFSSSVDDLNHYLENKR